MKLSDQVINWEKYPKLRSIFEERPRQNVYWAELDRLVAAVIAAGRGMPETGGDQERECRFCDEPLSPAVAGVFVACRPCWRSFAARVNTEFDSILGPEPPSSPPAPYNNDLATMQCNAHGMGQENAIERVIELLRGVGEATAANAVAEYFKFDFFADVARGEKKKLSRDGYQKLVDEDAAWLKTQPRTLERDHVIMVVEHSVRHYYPGSSPTIDTVDEAVLTSKVSMSGSLENPTANRQDTSIATHDSTPPERSKTVSCRTCGDQLVVNAPWPSGYPHAFPCPECRPNTPCDCGAENCPGPAAVMKWALKNRPGEQPVGEEPRE